MNRKFILLIIFVIVALHSFAGDKFSPVDYVNPLVGSLSKKELSTGNTYPAIARPWGMNFWTPQTGKMGDGWTYTYTADKVVGFKQTHQPSPWIRDYGQFSLMPITNKLVFKEKDRASWFSHKAEVAKPYYYSVYLADHDVLTELTATERAALFRFTFPKTDSAFVVIDSYDEGSYIKIDADNNRVYGYTTKNRGGVPENFKNYFVVEFDKAFHAYYGVNNGDIIHQKNEVKNDHAGAILCFQTKRNELIHARVASSFISFDQAEFNLLELGNDDFDKLVKKGKEHWNEVLGVVEVKDDNLDNLRTFYSCLYRSVLFPRKFYEINPKGEIVHYSPYNGDVLSGYMYTDTGFWDTFRSLFPLLNLLYPQQAIEYQKSLVNTYLESGFLPEWASPGHRSCMVGNNSASVVADAYINGLRGYDIETLWEAVVHGAHNVHPEVKSTGRWGYDYYNKLGYVPYDVGIKESAARTLEYAYNDWCIYQLGKSIGKSSKELAPYKERAFNYKNLFDSDYLLMRGKNKDGTFQSPFNPFKWGDAFTEGNSWHYTWSVFHDPYGLIQLMGGENSYNAMLDSIFELPPLFDASYYRRVIHEIREMQIMNMGNYAHGNQPIQHMIYMYNFARQPWKAQYWVREVMDKLYFATPDGYCGDEDNGQTSAWYVFSALGFYSMCPGSAEYTIGSPLFDKVVLHLDNNNQMVIKSKDNNTSNRYIENIEINGEKWSNNYIPISIIKNGGEIVYYMTDKPNKIRGVEDKNRPYSFSLFE